MKTNSTFKQILLALTIIISVAACKKDKKDPDPTPPAEVKAIALTDLKALSTGASVKVPDAKKITGIVISDASGKNIDSKNIVLQDAGSQAGIIIGFDTAPTFAVGDQVEVNISNQTLALVNGEVILQNIPAANAKKTGTGTITAKATTAAEIATNKAAWDGTLVKIAATELTGTTAKYSGTLTIKDASGMVSSAVLAGASFAGTDLPASVTAVTGIVRISGNDVRVDIRKATDIATGAITRIITEKFESVAGYLDDPTDISSGFSTPIGDWSGYDAPFPTYQTVFPEDADFTTAGRKYLYLWIPTKSTDDVDLVHANPLTCGFNNLKGLKTVSVTFSGSKSTAPFMLGNAAYPIKAFDPTKDFIQIGISAGGFFNVPLHQFIKKSEQYKKTGEFYTYTWTVPTKEELVAGGVDPDQADGYLKNPTFLIHNFSSSRAVSNDFDGGLSPIIFDKVVFSFGD